MVRENTDIKEFMEKLPISPKTILIALVIITIILAVLNLISQNYVLSGGGNELLLKAAGKLDLDGEKNSLSLWFQSSLMLFSAFLLIVIGLIRREAEDKDYRFWVFLSVVFLYLSLDETISIHEQLTVPLRQGLDLSGVFFMSWVVPVGIAVVIFFLISLKFLMRLPAKTRWMMIIAGAIYVGGALVMEMIDGAYYEKAIEPFGGVADWNYVLMTTVEESLESIGLAVFVYTLLSYLGLDILQLPDESAESVKPKVKMKKPKMAQFSSK
jgi:hypothetical protein